MGRAHAAALRLWSWFFPPRIELPPAALKLLRTLYPNLRLDRVRLHRGLPHAVRLLGSQAITLPALFASRRARLYFDPAVWTPNSVEGLGTLAHEAFHALQIQETGWGVGPFRPFLWLYFACGAANRFRYHGHPMEEDAYHHAGRPASRFESHLLEPCGGGVLGESDLARIGARASRLAIPSSGVEFWRRVAYSTPGIGRPLRRAEGLRSWKLLAAAPLIASWLALWIVATIAVWLLLVLLEITGLLIAGTVRLLAGGLEMLSNDAFSLSRLIQKD